MAVKPQYREDDPDGIVYDAITLAGYAGAVRWALGSKEVMDRFKAETGCPIPATRGINALIDVACGVVPTFVATFREWFDANIWGEKAPDGFWKEIA